MIIIIAVIFVFVGICIYGIVMPKYMIRHGRQVDARVISCELQNMEVGEENGSYYEVTVDFFDLDGYTVEKTIKTDEPYEVGSVIRSRYIDKTGRFLANADRDAQGKNQTGLWIILGVTLGILAIIISSVVLQDETGELPQWYTWGFGYVICILFMGIGVWGLVKKRKLAQRKHTIQVLPGYVVDFTKELHDDTYVYCPIYEYELMGVTYRYESRVSSNSTKRCTIGRKVHILRDCETGEVVCKEDEQTGSRLTTLMGIVGLIVFLILLGSSSDILNHQPSDKALSALQVYVMYEEGAEKCSYSVEIDEEGNGEIILFPTTSVSGKSIDQRISFEISASEMSQIDSWATEYDVSALSMGAVNTEEMYITIYRKEGDEQTGGRGHLSEAPYREMYDLLREIVPDDAWEELEAREEEYYQ